MIRSFSPLVNVNSRVLVLGSIPGVKSLQENQYYAHPYNQFWHIMYTILGTTYDSDYTKKTSLLIKHKIALWDVLYSCERAGSLDSHIIAPVSNDFKTFFSDYPKISVIFFNGTKARDTFTKLVGFSFGQIRAMMLLPSTSPARTIPFHEKLNSWQEILRWI